MDFLKGVFSFCHSIRTGCHSGRVKGFERYFEFVNRLKLSRRQHDHRPAILQVLRTQNKLHEPHLGNAKFLRGTIESHLGNEKPVKGIIKSHLGITKPNAGYDMPCLRNGFGRRYMYFTTHVKTSITRQTCAKAVAILYRGEKPRTSILHDNYYLSIAMNRSLHTVVRYQCFQKLESFIKMNQALNCSFTFQLSSIEDLLFPLHFLGATCDFPKRIFI